MYDSTTGQVLATTTGIASLPATSGNDIAQLVSIAVIVLGSIALLSNVVKLALTK